MLGANLGLLLHGEVSVMDVRHIKILKGGMTLRFKDAQTACSEGIFVCKLSTGSIYPWFLL